jgi:hypothetical protein
MAACTAMFKFERAAYRTGTARGRRSLAMGRPWRSAKAGTAACNCAYKIGCSAMQNTGRCRCHDRQGNHLTAIRSAVMAGAMGSHWNQPAQPSGWRAGRLPVKRRTRNGRNPGEVPLQASGGSPEHLKGQDDVRDSGCVLVCTSLDGLTRLGDVLTGSRRGVASTQKHCRAEEGEQGEGHHRRSRIHGDFLSLNGFGTRQG